MFKSILKAAAALALVIQGVHGAFPPLTLSELPKGAVSQCGGITFAWEGGQAPFKVYLMSQPPQRVMKVFPIQTGHYLDWQINLPGGTEFVYQVQSSPDENGAIQTATSGPYTIIDTADDSCVNTTIFDSNDGSAHPTPSPLVNITMTMVPYPTSAVGNSSPHPNINRTAIIGGVLGGLASLLLVALGLLCLVRRKNKVVESKILAEQKAKDLEAGDDDAIQKLPA